MELAEGGRGSTLWVVLGGIHKRKKERAFSVPTVSVRIFDECEKK